jgi:hypothetical protein
MHVAAVKELDEDLVMVELAVSIFGDAEAFPEADVVETYPVEESHLRLGK